MARRSPPLEWLVRAALPSAPDSRRP